MRINMLLLHRIATLLTAALLISSLGACGSQKSDLDADQEAEEAPAADVSQLRVGTFNMLRFGHGDQKDLQRMARLIAAGDFHIFSGIEVMTPESSMELVTALKTETGKDWAVEVSATSTGESTYKEYVAFFYRADVVKPTMPRSAFCRTDLSESRRNSTCFAKDAGEANGEPLFARDPFIGHFKAGRKSFALVAVHLTYSEGVAARRRELDALRTVMEAAKEKTPTADVIAMGDFNLALTAAGGPVMPEEFFTNGPVVKGLVDEVTTIHSSSYDHILYFEDNAQAVVPGSEEVLRDYNPNSQEQTNQYESTVSDHLPVGAAFQL